MASKARLIAEERAFIRFLGLENTRSARSISRIVGKSPSTILRVLRKFGLRPQSKKLRKAERSEKKKPGRKSKINDRLGRHIMRTIYHLRRTEGNFTVLRIMNVAGISRKDISPRTVRRFLNKNKIYYLQARKKGLLTEKDKKERVGFAKRMKDDTSFWTDKISFYLDGVSFAHKRNPLNQARAPKGRIYRKRSEGLDQYCTAKGSKVGTGGNTVKFIVAISYKKGVVLCEEYEHMNGLFFSNFVEKHFTETFNRSQKNSTKFIQDGDSSQNSKLASLAIENVGAELVKIPPRSPDLNPIENFFKSISDELTSQAITKQIDRESYTEFSERVKSTICNFPVSAVDSIIESMVKTITRPRMDPSLGFVSDVFFLGSTSVTYYGLFYCII